MLCPKCGYITFDALPSCPKCKKDWSDIAEIITGVGSMVEAPSFLGSAVREETDNEAAVVPESVTAMGDDEEPADQGEEAMDDGLTSEEGGLDLVLDDLPGSEETEPAIEMPEETGAPVDEEVSVEEESGGIAFELSDDEENAPDIELHAEADLSLEDEGLSLSPASERDADDEKGEAPAVDLHDIDLSDLMEPGATDKGREGAGADGEDSVLNVSSSDDVQKVPDLSGIDLSLEDDDGDDDDLDLSLEPEVAPSGPDSKEEKSAIPDLGLSLDLDD